jgi:hypothetical protein
VEVPPSLASENEEAGTRPLDARRLQLQENDIVVANICFLSAFCGETPKNAIEQIEQKLILSELFIVRKWFLALHLCTKFVWCL